MVAIEFLFWKGEHPANITRMLIDTIKEQSCPRAYGTTQHIKQNKSQEKRHELQTIRISMESHHPEGSKLHFGIRMVPLS